MATLDKVFDDLFKISNGDVATLTRATDEFVRDITQQNRIPLQVPPTPLRIRTENSGPLWSIGSGSEGAGS
jgi:hypothetical protein